MPFYAPPAVPLTLSSQPLHTGRDGFRQVVEVIIANANATNPATLTLNWTDASAGNVSALYLYGDVPAKDAVVAPRKVLEPGDKLLGFASATGYLTATVHVIHEEPVA